MGTVKGHPGNKAKAKKAGKTKTRDVVTPLVLVHSEPDWPDPPRGITAPAKAYWIALGESILTRVLDIKSDLHLLTRWIKLVDRHYRVSRALDSSMSDGDTYVTGSTGQVVAHPGFQVVAQLETQIRSIEKDLGIGPGARARVAVDTNEAQLSLRRLNVMGVTQDEDDDDDTIDVEGWE